MPAVMGAWALSAVEETRKVERGRVIPCVKPLTAVSRAPAFTTNGEGVVLDLTPLKGAKRKLEQ
ncbi:MAG: hypothetical protein ACREDR_47530 [Blastocatellia bacterium]